MNVETAIFCLLIGMTLSGAVVLLVVAWFGRRLGRALRLRALGTDTTGSSIVEVPFAVFVLIMFTVLVWQLGMLAHAYLVVDYIAFAAARSASVVLGESHGTAESRNRVRSLDFESPKGQAVLEAAALAAIPIAGRTGLPAMSAMARDVEEALSKRSFPGRPLRTAPPGDLAQRLSYARRNTDVRLVDGTHVPAGHGVKVVVTHRFALLIPFARRVFGTKTPVDGYVAPIVATATVVNEGFGLGKTPYGAPVGGKAVILRACQRLQAARRRLHEDEDGLMMPLVLFLMLAFSTSVVLVINTGHVTNDRINAQHAIDAATVSGGTAQARGMNYIAENNVTLAKVTATMAVIEALKQAVPDARRSLAIWLAIAKQMQQSGYPPTVAAGVALEVQVRREERILDGVEPGIDELHDRWITSGKALDFLRELTRIGDALMLITPLVAQHATRTVYRVNLIHRADDDAVEREAWMLPIYPHLPACVGIWGDLADKTTDYAKRYSRPVVAFGASVPLSFFALWHQKRLRETLSAYFDQEPRREGALPENKEIRTVRDRIDATESEIDALLRDRRRLEDERRGLEDTPVGALEEQVAQRSGRIDEIDSELDAIQAQVRELEAQLARLFRRAVKDAAGAEAEAAAQHDVAIGALPASSTLHPDIHPVLIDGRRFPSSFTWTAFGVRTPRAPRMAVLFGRGDKQQTAFVYATTRVMNPTAADLWTPDWRALLVRAREHDIAVQLEPVSGCSGRPVDGDALALLRASDLPLPSADVLAFAEHHMVHDGVSRH